jgi:sugar/nucleoside kinase (ribokinase family)
LRAAQRALKIVDVNTLPSSDEFRARLFESLSFADVFKTNMEGLQALRIALHREKETIRRFVEYLLKKYSLKLIAITLGENGCELFDGVRAVRVPGLPVRVVDTTGAGDAFSAGMIYKYLRGAALEEIAEFANLLGAYISTSAGATPVFSPASLETFKEALT